AAARSGLVSARPRTPWASSRWLAAAAVVAALAIGGLVVGRQAFRSPLSAVIAAAPSERPYESRLSGLPYTPVQPVARGRTDGKPSWKLLKARDEAQQATTARPSADSWRAAGIADVLLGDVDAAVVTLKKGVEAFPNSAALQSDLAAAQFAQYKTS